MLRYLTTLVFLIKMRLYFSFIARVNNVFLTEDCYDKNLSIFLLSFISSFCFPERKPGKTMSLHTYTICIFSSSVLLLSVVLSRFSLRSISSNHKIFFVSRNLCQTQLLYCNHLNLVFLER